MPMPTSKADSFTSLKSGSRKMKNKAKKLLRDFKSSSVEKIEQHTGGINWKTVTDAFLTSSAPVIPIFFVG